MHVVLANLSYGSHVEGKNSTQLTIKQSAKFTVYEFTQTMLNNNGIDVGLANVYVHHQHKNLCNLSLVMLQQHCRRKTK